MARTKKSLLDKEIEQRQRRIRELLLAGMGVADVSKEIGITPKRVYVVAERWKLPTNPTIWPGSDDESSVARLTSCGWTPGQIGKLFNQSPKSIEAILKRIKERPVLQPTARRFRVDEAPRKGTGR